MEDDNMDWDYIFKNEDMVLEFQKLLKEYFNNVYVYHNDVEYFFSLFNIDVPDIDQVHFNIEYQKENYNTDEFDYYITVAAGIWIDIFICEVDRDFGDYDYYINGIEIDY